MTKEAYSVFHIVNLYKYAMLLSQYQIIGFIFLLKQ